MRSKIQTTHKIYNWVCNLVKPKKVETAASLWSAWSRWRLKWRGTAAAQDEEMKWSKSVTSPHPLYCLANLPVSKTHSPLPGHISRAPAWILSRQLMVCKKKTRKKKKHLEMQLRDVLNKLVLFFPPSFNYYRTVVVLLMNMQQLCFCEAGNESVASTRAEVALILCWWCQTALKPLRVWLRQLLVNG